MKSSINLPLESNMSKENNIASDEIVDLKDNDTANEDELSNDMPENEEAIANDLVIDEKISEEIKEEVIKIKKNKHKKKGYFYEEEEQAVISYLTADTEDEKDRIFREILYPAFTQMAEAIIRRYKLYPPDEEYDETFHDAISFLMTKIDRFDMSSNYKAYSYCGTIIKNYLIYKLNSFSKKQKRNESYENVKNYIEEDINYSTVSNENTQLVNDILSQTINKINEMVTNYKFYRLSRDELNVGKALLNVLQNWDELLLTDGSNKFTKSSVLLLLKETTGMTTKQVRDCMKKYKNAYYNLKEDIVSLL